MLKQLVKKKLTLKILFEEIIKKILKVFFFIKRKKLRLTVEVATNNMKILIIGGNGYRFSLSRTSKQK